MTGKRGRPRKLPVVSNAEPPVEANPPAVSAEPKNDTSSGQGICPKCKGLGYLEFEAGLIRVKCPDC